MKPLSRKIVGVIPARFGSKRLPGKPLVDINGKPMIQHVWERALRSKYLDLVLIATDDDRIYNKVLSFGGNAVMTSKNHKSGTDRVYEAVRKIDCNIVVNIQGDEPFIHPNNIDLAISPLLLYKDINVTTLCHLISSKHDIEDPNIVKVLFDRNSFAIYFSRFPIPFKRLKTDKVNYYKHIGLYAYRRDFLVRYVNMKQANSEKAEKLEQLRIIENGEKIKVVETKYDSISIDTFEDLKKIKDFKKIKYQN